MAYKTVKERILDCDIAKLRDEFFVLNRDEKLTEPNTEYCEIFNKIINNLMGITPTDEEVFVDAVYDKYVVNDMSEQEDFSINSNGVCLALIDIGAYKAGDTREYSFMYNEWEASLGYKVSDELVDEFGLETLMAVVIWQMTWWGKSAEEVHNYIVETEQALDKVKEKFKWK